MKIGIYSPYLDSFGGGERYVLTAAEILSRSHQVDLFFDPHLWRLDAQQLKSNLERHFNLDLSRVGVVKAPIGPGSNFFERIIFLKKYDLMFCLTDGSIFYSTAKKNILHFQVPFKNLSAKNLWGKLKLSSWTLAACNSKFTENVIKKEWPIKTIVVYPPVSVEDIKPLAKKKIILSVGRFASFSKSKKHEEMIETFKIIQKGSQTSGWSLCLAGSVEGEDSYIEELKTLAQGYQVNFYPNLPYYDLLKLYGESSIYWHTAGFGETDPSKMEHFGMTTVEAMAGGCVPIVINKGGQPEIVEDGINGFLWDSLEELKNSTLKLIKDEKIIKKMSNEAVKRSKIFSKERFSKQILDLIQIN